MSKIYDYRRHEYNGCLGDDNPVKEFVFLAIPIVAVLAGAAVIGLCTYALAIRRRK
jgi:hypothetical protein